MKMKYIHILFFLYLPLTNLFASDSGEISHTENSRDCPDGQILDCSQICWPEDYYQPNNNICENGGGTEENTFYPNFSCESWGFDGAVCNGELLGESGEGNYYCNDGEFVEGDISSLEGDEE